MTNKFLIINMETNILFLKILILIAFHIFLSNTSLVVNDENLGKKLIEYIEEKVQIKLELYKNENELNNHSQNIINSLIKKKM